MAKRMIFSSSPTTKRISMTRTPSAKKGPPNSAPKQSGYRKQMRQKGLTYGKGY